MDPLINLIALCPENISDKVLAGNDIALLKVLIDNNLFRYNPSVEIVNVDILKLLIEKEFINKDKLVIDHKQHLAIIKYCIEELKMEVDYPDLLRSVVVYSSSEKLLTYIVSKGVDVIKPFKYDNRNSVIRNLIQSKNEPGNIRFLEILKHVYNEFPEQLDIDLAGISISSLNVAKYLVEEIGYDSEKLSRHSLSDLPKYYSYTKQTKRLKCYIAVAFLFKFDSINFPQMIKLKVNNKYYYGFLLKHEDNIEQIKKYSDIMAGIGNAKIYYL